MPDGMNSPGRSTPRPLTVLAVASDKDLLGLVKAVLAANNHHILIAENQRDGLALASGARPDVILAMSGVDDLGPALCAQVRHDPQLAEIPFVMMTTSVSRKTYADYFAKGCDQILPVPFRCNELHAAIKNACKRGLAHRSTKVHVLLRSGRADFVAPAELDRLLEEREILCFRREGNVATVGRDPLRCAAPAGYAGPERRTRNAFS